MVKLPRTYEEFFWKLISALPKGYKRIDLVADTYKNLSIKSGERSSRGSSSKVIITSAKAKLPPDFNRFMTNGENKTRLIELFSEELRKNSSKCLQILKSSVIYISQENITYQITENGVEVAEELSSDQEEADTKLILHCHHAMNSMEKVVLRSPSGDTDILVLALASLERDTVYLDYGNGKARRGIWLNQFRLNQTTTKALIGFHAYTGSDYVSSFFKKGKAVCWKQMMKNPKFINAFGRLGQAWNLSDDRSLFQHLEEFTCSLYNVKREESVNIARQKLFEIKFSKQGKIVDLALLPPCQSVLYLHCKRANYVAKLWRLSLESRVEPVLITQHGWQDDAFPQWVEDVFPEDVSELLLEESFPDQPNIYIEDDDYISEDDE